MGGALVDRNVAASIQQVPTAFHARRDVASRADSEQQTVSHSSPRSKFVRALIGRELCRTIKREPLTALPLYTEQRRCARPSSERALLFSQANRHLLSRAERIVQELRDQAHPLRRQVLGLLGGWRAAERLPGLTIRHQSLEISSEMCGK